MVYFDNIIFSLQKAGGISVVWANLIRRISRMNEDSVFLEYEGADDNIFRVGMELPKDRIKVLRGFNKVLSQYLSPHIKSNQPFIFHSSYFRTSNNRNAINVTTVHDFIYEQNTRPTFRQKLRMMLNYRAIKRSDAIVCISDNTRKDLFKYVPDIDARKVSVIYNGVSEDYFPVTETPYPQYGNYILFVGGRQGYKNFEFVARALRQTDYKLLVCGASLSQSETEMLETHLKNRYVHIGFPSNTELNKIYNSVYALAYPSSYEGFGIPVLEAQRAGCPVVALASSSIPEIIGDNALLMSELSEKKFVDLLDKISDDNERVRVVNQGRINARRFSWDKMANAYMELYSSLLSN